MFFLLDQNYPNRSCKREKPIKCVTKTAEDTLKQSAIIRQDEIMMRKISGEDLVAKEAHYHE